MRGSCFRGLLLLLFLFLFLYSVCCMEGVYDILQMNIHMFMVKIEMVAFYHYNLFRIDYPFIIIRSFSFEFCERKKWKLQKLQN